MSVIIETTLGDLTLDLLITKRPKVCFNFLKLCKMKYYNFSLFHSIQTDFIAQTGDPTGKGSNGQSIFSFFLGENAKYYHSDTRPTILHNRIGLISMVNCGDNMFGSQFFITLGSDLQSLDNKHCVFGEVTEGIEVLSKLNETICDHNHRPFRDIRITHTIILDDPFLNPPNLVLPENSPEPTPEKLLTDRIAPDEEIDEGENILEIEERQRMREAKAQATILEMVGDIPHADIAPPENVLFVCKLNPLTKEEDLEIIFDRFGKINSCEVIKDEITGNSLQYAFIEFDNRKSCEDAYFKMDNVLIDDRRIHVDFSQSVAKYKWRGKGRGVEIEDNNKKIRDSNKIFYKDQDRREIVKRHKYHEVRRTSSKDRNIEMRNQYKPKERSHSRSRSNERLERYNRYHSEAKSRNSHKHRRSRSTSKIKWTDRSRSRNKEKQFNRRKEEEEYLSRGKRRENSNESSNEKSHMKTKSKKYNEREKQDEKAKRKYSDRERSKKDKYKIKKNKKHKKKTSSSSSESSDDQTTSSSSENS